MHVVRVGDAVMAQADFRDTLRLVADVGGCDMILTSPPYHDARTVAAYGAPAWTMQDDRDLGDAVFAALRPGGHCLLVVDAPVREWRRGVGTERGLQPWRLLIDWADRVGLRVVDRLAYARHGQCGEYKGRFRNDFELLLWFQRPGQLGYFNKGALDVPAARGIRAGQSMTQRRPDGTMRTAREHGGRMYSGDAAKRGVKRRGTLWEYGAVGKGCSGSLALEATGHPARFPLRLALEAVACFCSPGGVVVDPFTGSGTTALAARRLGRLFRGGDLGSAPDGRPWIDIAADVLRSES